MSKEKVMAVLEPKAQPFGFSSEELQSVGDKIAEILPEGATDEQIAQSVESYIPFLKLAQSASNRSFERMKAQFEKEHKETPKPKKQTDSQKPDEKQDDPTKDNKPSGDEEPAWFKSYREKMEQKQNELEERISSMRLEKTSEGLMAKALEQLKAHGVDKNFYSLMLEDKTFEKEEEATAFVTKIKASWDTLKRERDIKDLVNVAPPKPSHPAPDKPSQAVRDRIEKRKKAKVSSAIQGLEEEK